LKQAIKKFGGKLMGDGFVYDLVRSAGRRKLLILFYTRVVEASEVKWVRDRNMCVDIERFDEQMGFVGERYTPVSESEVIRAVEGVEPLPDNAVWVTFDEGYKDNFVNAYPILRRYDIPATFFVAAGYVNRDSICAADYIPYALRTLGEGEVTLADGDSSVTCRFEDEQTRLSAASRLWDFSYTPHVTMRERVELLEEAFGIPLSDVDGLFMDWDDIRDMCRGGQSVGVDTVDYISTAALTGERIIDAVRSSKTEIEKRTRNTVRAFAYPRLNNACFDIATCAPVLRDSGIRLGVTTTGGHNVPGDPGRTYSLGRLGVSHNDDINAFRFKVGAGSFRRN